MATVVDTSFVIDLLRGREDAVEVADGLDQRADAVLLPTPVLYEVTAGLRFARSRSEAQRFRELADRFVRLPFDGPAAEHAAEIRAELLRLGKAKSHTDVMIAGTALAGGHRLVTRDADFQAIADVVGLSLEPYGDEPR